MTKKQIRSLMGILITLCLAWLFQREDVSKQEVEVVEKPTVVLPASTSTVSATNALVMRVIDGDTLEAFIDHASTSAKIRLLGVNTPESVDPRRSVECFGKEASRFLKNMVEGKRVRLEEDVQADDRDKYGRLLRNILLDDGTDVNALLVKEGYAYAYLSFPLDKRRKNELSRLQEEAKTEKSGLWNVETCDGMR